MLRAPSNQFIAGNQSTAKLGASDCARWLSVYPHAGSCAQAALNDWTWETIGYRIAFGMLGLLALGLLVLARRRAWHGPNWAPLPATVVDSIATTLFGISGVWLAGLGIDALTVSSGHGAGQWLSAAPVALTLERVVRAPPNARRHRCSLIGSPAGCFVPLVRVSTQQPTWASARRGTCFAAIG